MANPLAEIKRLIELGSTDSPEAASARVEEMAKQLQSYSAVDLEKVTQLVTDLSGSRDRSAAIDAARAEVARQPRGARMGP